VGSFVRGIISDNGRPGRAKIGVGFSKIVAFLGIGLENADLVKGALFGIELVRGWKGTEYSWG
jgi:hypothetical protein